MSKLNSVILPSIVIDLSKYSSWEEAKAEFKVLIGSKISFWQNTALIIRFADFEFESNNLDELKTLLNESGLTLKEIQSNSIQSWKLIKAAGFQVNKSQEKNSKSSNGIRLIKQFQPSQANLETIVPANAEERKTIYLGLKENISLRAGHLVSYNGNIVIMGDVNPGCQIKATGSIIVYGKLCGSVHAGFGITDEEELTKIFVKALKMGDPLQISIGDYAACSSSESQKKQKMGIFPETAKVIDGRIWRISDFE